jgi:glycosyltransferase involved in cell wall biosynthesis
MSSASPLVSVILPTWNRAEYLPGAIRSALAQTYAPIEIHVVDDGSTDDTEKVMRAFVNDSRVRYQRLEHQGPSRARNAGIRESRGSFIALLDADDLWTPDKLEHQIPAFENDPRVGVVYTNFQSIDVNGDPIPTDRPEPHSGFVSGKLLINNFVPGPTSVIRRECFDAVGGFDEELQSGEDYDLWLRISTKFEFRVLDLVTYLYRLWPGQISHDQSTTYACAVRIMRRFIEANPDLVNPVVVREAWAHTYVGRGETLRVVDRQPLGALSFYARAIRERPRYLPAWKGVAKLVLPWLAHDEQRLATDSPAHAERAGRAT